MDDKKYKISFPDVEWVKTDLGNYKPVGGGNRYMFSSLIEAIGATVTEVKPKPSDLPVGSIIKTSARFPWVRVKCGWDYFSPDHEVDYDTPLLAGRGLDDEETFEILYLPEED